MMPVDTANTKKKAKRKFRILHNGSWCKACGLCYEFCPTDVIEGDLHGKAVFARLEDCIGCNKCVFYCPDFCTYVEESDEFELVIEKSESG